MNVKCSIKNALRIGKKGQSDKPRLLKVTLTTVKDKVIILRNKSLLRREGVPEFARNIYITRELTPTEQENNKKLRQELNELNKDGKKYIYDKKWYHCAEESLNDPSLCIDCGYTVLCSRSTPHFH